jgi:hypothetical protein
MLHQECGIVGLRPRLKKKCRVAYSRVGFFIIGTVLGNMLIKIILLGMVELGFSFDLETVCIYQLHKLLTIHRYGCVCMLTIDSSNLWFGSVFVPL